MIVTAGASAALLLLAAALVEPGEKVLVGDPSYPCNRRFVEGFGGRARLVPTEAHVALTPGLDFGAGGANDFLRLSYAADEADLERALEAMGRFRERLA